MRENFLAESGGQGAGSGGQGVEGREHRAQDTGHILKFPSREGPGVGKERIWNKERRAGSTKRGTELRAESSGV